MAARSLLAAALRRCYYKNHNPNPNPNPNPSNCIIRSPPAFLFENPRSHSSGPLRDEDPAEESHPPSDDDLKSRIFRLRLPKRSATAALEKWVGEGRKATAPMLREIARDLRRSQRYKHALEISEWMLRHHEPESLDLDYAVRIDLITKVFGIVSAEEFFQGLPSSAKTCETYTALLHSYARAKLLEKAESLFAKIKESDLNFSAITFNEMMTLYMSVGQLEKVSLVVEELKTRNVSPDLFTYNLWASACAATQDIDGVRRILDEMGHDPNANKGWRTYMKLTDMYVTAGHLMNAANSLAETEKKVTQREWITYDFLIILHASLGNKEKINEIWKSLRMTSQKMSSRNYICIISSYLMLGHLKEAGDMIDEWKQSKYLDFDITVCKKLFDALGRADSLAMA